MWMTMAVMMGLPRRGDLLMTVNQAYFAFLPSATSWHPAGIPTSCDTGLHAREYI